MGWFGRGRQGKAEATAAQGVIEGGEAPETFWRAVGVTCLPFGPEQSLLAGPGGTLVSVPQGVAELLCMCDRFKTLDELEAEIGEQTRFPVAEIRPALQCLAEAGILFPMDRLASPGEPLPAARVDSVGVVTHNRLPAVQRCLESFMANARRHGRSPVWRVFHDGEDPGLCAEYQAMLSALGRQAGMPVAYAGPEERRVFMDALVQEGLPRDVVAFGLVGPPEAGRGAGASLNARLLDLVGQVGLSLDDDTFCRLGQAPEPLAGTELAGGVPSSFRFFQDRAAALNAFPVADADYLALHEALLGRTFGELWSPSGLGRADDLGRAPDRLLLAAASGGRVAVTQTGLAGDSGMGSTLYYLLMEGEERERLLARPADLEAFMASRAVARSVQRQAVGDGAHFMAYAVGFDHRQLLPPFLPRLRSTDTLFGITLLETLPERMVGHLPWLVAHDPPEARQETEASLARAAGSLKFGAIMEQTLAFQARGIPQGLGAEDRLRALGRGLQVCGALPPQAYAEWLHPILLRGLASQVMRLEGVLERHGARPAPWAAKVQANLDLARALPWTPDWPAPSDFPGNPGREGALSLAARLTRQFGGLLEHWPDLVAVAGRLREKGVTLAKPV